MPLLLQQELRKQGIGADIFTPFLDDTALCLQKSADGAYDMVVFSLFFSTIKDDLRFFDEIKQRLPRNTPIIAEGMLAAHAIEHCLSLGFDAVLSRYAHLYPEAFIRRWQIRYLGCGLIEWAKMNIPYFSRCLWAFRRWRKRLLNR